MQATINGVKLGYIDEGKGTPVVFIHGFPLSRGAWQKQVDALRGNYRVIVPDLRGMGESDAHGDITTMAQFADDIHALLTQLNTGPVVLLGHSMGGYIALAFAQKYPQMLKGLGLIATKSGADSPEAAAGRKTTAEKVRAEGSKVVIDAMTPKMLAAGNQDEAMSRQVRSLMTGAKPEGVIAALLGMAQRPDSTPMLAQIKVPALIVTGADDVVIPPAESQKMADAIRGSKMVSIPKAGHLVAFEQAEAFNLALMDWLRGLKS